MKKVLKMDPDVLFKAWPYYSTISSMAGIHGNGIHESNALTALMVFATAFGTALFGVLIDYGFSIEKIAVVSGIYIIVSIVLLFFIRKKLNPINT